MIETFSLIDIEDDTAKEIIRKKIEKYILLYKKYFSKIEKKIEENKDTISQVEPSII
ncbi:MAG: hypothetical protein P1U46_02640 [Patescibacteria group bacterium]|nr:hypothetical protein [Patescibacteria group bacterium]